jgi:disulfide bond formation protein DsbB
MPPRVLLAGTAGISLAAVGLALWSQHGFGMEPCPWCVLQRLIFVAIALACVPGLLVPRPLARWASAPLVAALAAAGLAAALWQHFVAAASASCNLTLADRVLAALGLDAALPEIFQPRASCADAAVNLLGVPYEFWSGALYVAIAAAAAWLAWRGR